MYKYLCVISDNADKKDFYDTVEKVKNCYPDYRDAPEEKSDISCLQRVMSITEKKVDKNICIRYDFADETVSVLSDIYLKKFFKGKKVENISGYSNELSKAVSIILCVIFAALNFFSLLFTGVESFLWIIYSGLAVIYIISALIIKNKWKINEFKILFIQSGGYITIAILLIAFFSGSLAGAAIIWLFFIAVIPALTLNLEPVFTS